MSNCSKFKKELIFQPMNIQTILNANDILLHFIEGWQFYRLCIRYSKYEETKLLWNINNWKRGAFDLD